ncbi:hypothetical protein [Williamsia sp. CHRR-6]|uniref:hypothetical protein n=1 Tax=Williamsia sp. CHRR-6 TaxID=2835871 RepID=UPI001BDB1087|nr:hypothetical protein [Williamsia sp. CHRR-6]MBT0567263.1 hypothetical protein [Williamsia sp. CHRR-6]
MASLQISDIARWDAVAVGAVADACKDLSKLFSDETDDLDRLPVFETWRGDAADAAAGKFRKLKSDADKFLSGLLIVGGASASAKDAIDELHRELAAIRVDAEAAGLEIIGETSTVHIAPTTGGLNDERIAELDIAIGQIGNRIAKLIEKAEATDKSLAIALGKLAPHTKDSVWSINGADAAGYAVGVLKSVQTDMLTEFGKELLKGSGSKTLAWLDDLHRFIPVNRVGVIGTVAMTVPSIISDMGKGDGFLEATTKEGAGAVAGIAAGMASGAGTGAVLGTFVPAPGVATAAGVVVGAVVGGFAALATTKFVGQLWD